MAYKETIRQDVAGSVIAKKTSAISKEIGRLRQVRFAELDKEFLHQARELNKLTRTLRNKFKQL